MKLVPSYNDLPKPISEAALKLVFIAVSKRGLSDRKINSLESDVLKRPGHRLPTPPS